MNDSKKILVVEDEMIIGAKISLHLTSMGYEVTGIIPRGEEAIAHIESHPPDIVLLDIQLKGQLDGIETAQAIKARKDIPIIYLTANADDINFNRARETKPEAFISKPYKKLDLQRAIELVVSRMNGKVLSTPEEDRLLLEDRIFVRDKDRRVKVMIKDILYMESDRNYTKIFTRDKEFLLAATMKKIEERLSPKHFLRIHRSYLINLSQIDAVADSHVVINNKPIPIGRGMKAQLLERIKLL